MKTTEFVNMLCAPDGAELAKGAGRLVNSLLVDVEEIISGILERPTATENFQALCCAWCLKQSELLGNDAGILGYSIAEMRAFNLIKAEHTFAFVRFL